MNFQLKQNILSQLQADNDLQIEILKYTGRSITTMSNCINQNLPMLTNIGVLVIIRNKLLPNAPIEDMLEVRSHKNETVRQGVEL